MSEIGYISSRYDRLSQTNQYLNEAVLLLMKDWLRKQPDAPKKSADLFVDAEDIRLAQDYVVEILDKPGEFSQNRIIDQLLENRQFSSQGDLDGVVRAIRQNQPLESRHFKTLDRLLNALDSERSVLFRKLQARK